MDFVSLLNKLKVKKLKKYFYFFFVDFMVDLMCNELTIRPSALAIPFNNHKEMTFYFNTRGENTQ